MESETYIYIRHTEFFHLIQKGYLKVSILKSVNIEIPDFFFHFKCKRYASFQKNVRYFLKSGVKICSQKFP